MWDNGHMDLAKLQHPGWWGLVVPIGLAIGSTFTPGTVRSILLILMIGAVGWTIHNTEFGAKRWKVTGLAAGICAILAVLIFFLGRAMDARQKPKEQSARVMPAPGPSPPTVADGTPTPPRKARIHSLKPDDEKVLQTTPSASSPRLPLTPKVQSAVPIKQKNKTERPIASTDKPPEPTAPATVGNITQGVGSIAQVGGTGNTAIITGTNEWVLTTLQQITLHESLRKSTGRVRMSWWDQDPGSSRYASALAYAFKEAGWKIEDQLPNYAGSFCFASAEWDCFGLQIVVRNRSSNLASTAISALSILAHLHVAVSEKNDEDLVDVFVSKAP